MKKMICIFLLVSMLISSILNYQLFADASTITKLDLQTTNIVVNCKDQLPDISGIRFSVYKMIFTEHSYNNSILLFDTFQEELLTTVTTDSNGCAEFLRSCSHCKIEVQLDSLPSGYGINQTSVQLFSSDSVACFIIEKIDRIEIPSDQNESGIMLYHKNNRVFAKTETRKYEELLSFNETSATIKHMISVMAGSISEYREYDEVLIFDNEINNDILDDTTDCCFAEPESRSLLTHSIISDNGNFKVYYDPIEFESPQTARTIASFVANEYETIYNRFCVQWTFLKPYTTSLNDYYEIDIDSSSSGKASTSSCGNDGYSILSKIKIKPSTAIAAYSGTNSEPYRGSFAHEYMHAIMFRYGINYSGNDNKWFHESCASWAGMVYKSAYHKNKYKNVTKYLNSLYDDPLTYYNKYDNPTRYPGTLLFFLYIEQYYGGHTTIASVFSKFLSNTPPDPIAAISQTLTDINSNNLFSSVFTTYSAYLYDPDEYFNTLYGYYNQINSGDAYMHANGHIKPDVIGVEAYPAASTESTLLSNLSNAFIEFTPPQNANALMFVTINRESTTLDGELHLKIISTDAAGQRYINYVSTYEHTNVMFYNFSPSTYESIVIMAANPGLTGTVEITYSASLLYYPINGAQYSFKNRGSGKYMNVRLGIDANGTNVYQYTKDNSIEQNFQLNLISTNVYEIRALCSSDSNGRVIDIQKNNGYVVDGCNVQIWLPVDPAAQRWNIIEVDYGVFRIVPASNTALALSTYGDSNGNYLGVTSTSPGNVFVSTYSVGNNYQLWEFVPAVSVSE